MGEYITEPLSKNSVKHHITIFEHAPRLRSTLSYNNQIQFTACQLRFVYVYQPAKKKPNPVHVFGKTNQRQIEQTFRLEIFFNADNYKVYRLLKNLISFNK